MREYGRVATSFWSGKINRQLKGDAHSLALGMYLETSQHSNLLGLYLLPLAYVANDTGFTIEQIKTSLARLHDLGFCSYDEETEIVWVHEAALTQTCGPLKPTDNQVKGVQRVYDALQDNPFLAAFFDRYADAFHMTHRRGEPLGRPFEEPTKSYAVSSQIQIHDHEDIDTHARSYTIDIDKCGTSEGITAADLAMFGYEQGYSSLDPSMSIIVSLLKLGVTYDTLRRGHELCGKVRNWRMLAAQTANAHYSFGVKEVQNG